MNLAVTLVIQGIVFFAVAWVLKILFWSDIMLAIETRQKKIADGLAAASKSEKDLDEAQARSKEIIREARDRAAQIVDQAGKRSNEIVEEAKGTAVSEALAEGMTVMDYAPNSPAAEDIMNLVTWIRNTSVAVTASQRGMRWSER